MRPDLARSVQVKGSKTPHSPPPQGVGMLSLTSASPAVVRGVYPSLEAGKILPGFLASVLGQRPLAALRALVLSEEHSLETRSWVATGPDS